MLPRKTSPVPPLAAILILILASAFARSIGALHAASLEVPAITGYADPDAEGVRFSSRRRVVAGWTNPAVSLRWFGLFRTNAELGARLRLRLPAGVESRLQLAVDGRTNALTVRGTDDGSPVVADFGRFRVDRPGYTALTLVASNPPGAPSGDLEAWLLEGPALENAHFNLEERRNAASVHLAYPVPASTNVAAFYSEVTALEDPTSSFYMACGWHRGYFGMQVNSPSERRIIFSVWDSGDEAVDRAKVADENRVRLMGKGDGVFTGDFGNEGTGGHSHLKYPWKTGETQRFLVTAQPTNGTFTVFSGYYFHPDSRAWMLISSWKAPKEGGWLKRLHGFSENFWGSNGHRVRKALYGNQWIRTDDGTWMELTTATFSHDPTGKSHRLDRFMGVEDGRFFLSHGGFVEGFTTFGTRFDRPPTGVPPSDIVLPAPR
ncbi:MAG: DUF3472 domain-containing protein [Verrucomicrobiales bacterium]|nr:DUF3472 domain-containing protein [Verrucomicrobiales bacterium]